MILTRCWRLHVHSMGANWGRTTKHHWGTTTRGSKGWCYWRTSTRSCWLWCFVPSWTTFTTTGSWSHAWSFRSNAICSGGLCPSRCPPWRFCSLYPGCFIPSVTTTTCLGEKYRHCQANIFQPRLLFSRRNPSSICKQPIIHIWNLFQQNNNYKFSMIKFAIVELSKQASNQALQNHLNSCLLTCMYFYIFCIF